MSLGYPYFRYSLYGFKVFSAFKEIAVKAVCVSEMCQYPEATFVKIESTEFPTYLILGITKDAPG